MNQQRMLIDVVLDAYEFPVKIMPLHKLTKYVDLIQLTPALGGSCAYDAQQWCDVREVRAGVVVY
jgi:hypothetical protein